MSMSEFFYAFVLKFLFLEMVYILSLCSIHGLKWNKYKLHLKALDSDVKGMLYLTMTKKATIWLDQVSAMPQDTYKGHGYIMDLFEKILALKPQFLRFPDQNS
ncbi:hypothetical protein Droror1_Dr00019841 [Drosera rotundifolia]